MRLLSPLFSEQLQGGRAVPTLLLSLLHLLPPRQSLALRPEDANRETKLCPAPCQRKPLCRWYESCIADGGMEPPLLMLANSS